MNVCFQHIFLRLQVKGSLLESLIEKRARYLENCNKSLSTLPQTGEPPVACSNLRHPDDFFFSLLTHFQITGIYCKGTFDMFLCWPHSSPGNVSVPCPSYLPWISEGDHFIELFPFYTTTENMQPDGCAGRRKHAYQCLAQSADDSRRAHRECLGTGKWQERPNSSEPWRDDSECREDHYFKDKVMHHY